MDRRTYRHLSDEGCTQITNSVGGIEIRIEYSGGEHAEHTYWAEVMMTHNEFHDMLRRIGWFEHHCRACGGRRGERTPADRDGLGCLENIYHTEDFK